MATTSNNDVAEKNLALRNMNMMSNMHPYYVIASSASISNEYDGVKLKPTVHY